MIDTDVLVRAEQGDERHDHCFNVLRLLGAIRASNHVIAVDDGDIINREYRRNLDSSGLVYRFLQSFASRGRVRYVSGRLTNRMSRDLRNLHFDPDDDVFVAVASISSSGRLVAEETDYSVTIVDYLSNRGVRVINCEVASSEANP